MGRSSEQMESDAKAGSKSKIEADGTVMDGTTKTVIVGFIKRYGVKEVQAIIDQMTLLQELVDDYGKDQVAQMIHKLD